MEFLCNETSVGIRLDVFLTEQAELTRSAAQKLIEAGEITVNGSSVAKNYKLRAGDVIFVMLPEPACHEAEPENIPVDIMYEDDAVIIVNKPQGMVVHPAAGHMSGTLVNALLYHAEGRLSAINGVVRPGIVHRMIKIRAAFWRLRKPTRLIFPWQSRLKSILCVGNISVWHGACFRRRILR